MSAPEKPLHALHAFATFVAAGPQVRVAEMINALGSAWRHSIVPLDGHSEALSLLDDGIDARLFDPPAGQSSLVRIPAMRRMIQREDPDLLLTYNWGSFDAVMAARTLSRRPHVHHEEGFNIDEVAGQKRRRVLCRRLFLRRCHRVVVCSSGLVSIARDTWGVRHDRVQLIHNGIHPDRFTPGASEVRAQLGIPEDALVIGAVGHVRPIKNLPRLVEAFAHLDRAGRRAHLLVVGDGPERARLEGQARSLGDAGGRIHFPGHQSDLRGFYRAMDVFAISSDSEQHPVVLLEAMSTGLPAVSTDVGDVGLVLPEEQQRFLVPVEAEDAPARLARLLEELLASPELRERLGAQNRTRVIEGFSFEGMLEAYRGVYGAALAAG